MDSEGPGDSRLEGSARGRRSVGIASVLRCARWRAARDSAHQVRLESLHRATAHKASGSLGRTPSTYELVFSSAGESFC